MDNLRNNTLLYACYTLNMAEPLIEHPPRQDIIQLRQLMKETPDFPGITLTFPFPLSEDRQHALSALKTGVLPAGKESLFTHPDFVVQQAAHFTEAHGNVPIPLEPFTWLLLSRKAALATPFRENIASNELEYRPGGGHPSGKPAYPLQ